ncbi:hypothetical protein [Streptomyces sp. 8N706]
MSRATGLVHEVEQLYSHAIGVSNAQTLGFWSYLEARSPGH